MKARSVWKVQVGSQAQHRPTPKPETAAKPVSGSRFFVFTLSAAQRLEPLQGTPPEVATASDSSQT